jgi:hypothetical protein
MLIVVGMVGTAAAFWQGRARAARAVAILLVAVWCGYGFVAHPVLDPSSSASALMRRARVLAGPEIAIGLVQWKEQNLLQALGPTEEFGYRQPVAEQLRRARLWLQADPLHRRLLFSQPRSQPSCFAGGGTAAQLVGTANRRDWYLVPRDALGEHCFDPARLEKTP